MRGALIGTSRDSDMSFLGCPVRITPSEPSSWQLVPSSPVAFTQHLKGELEAEKSLSVGGTQMIRNRKKGKCLLCIPTLWLVRGVDTSFPEAISLAIFCLLLVPAISRGEASGKKTLLPFLLYKKVLHLFCVHLSWHNFFFQLLKAPNQFLMCLWSPESQLDWKWAI